jgi:hypothetical protein
MRVALIALLAGCASSGAGAPRGETPPPSATRLPDDAIVETMLERLGRAARCPESRRVWCIAANGWAEGAAAPLPAATRVLVGISVGLERDRGEQDLLAVDVSLSALALRVDGERRFGLITDIPPENPAEQRLVRDAVTSVGRVLKGDAERVELAPSLSRYAAGLGAQASYPLERTAGEWRMTGKSNARLRKIGGVWVAVEVPRAGPEGIFVSLYPE